MMVDGDYSIVVSKIKLLIFFKKKNLFILKKFNDIKLED